MLIPVVALICAFSYCLYLGNECGVFRGENVSLAEKADVVSSDLTEYTCRTEFRDSFSNYGMLANEMSVNGFNSFKSKATMSFCRLAGFDTGSVTKAYYSTPAVQAVLSIRYTVSRDGTRENAKYYVPFGFAYDRYVIDDGLEETTDRKENNRRIEQMCSACYLDRQTADRLRDVLEPLESTDTDWKAACLQRRQSACTECVLSASGIRAVSAGSRDRLVYFSVPHDRGWRAFIDGEETTIHTVNGGMMGVVVPAGEHRIEFRFETPGSKAGVRIGWTALGAICIWGIREATIYHKKKKTR